MTAALPVKNQRDVPPPDAPDFEEILKRCANAGWDALLLTPGGCKSCLKNRAEMPAHMKNTRFGDIFLATGTVDELAEKILAAFSAIYRINFRKLLNKGWARLFFL